MVKHCSLHVETSLFFGVTDQLLSTTGHGWEKFDYFVTSKQSLRDDKDNFQLP